LKKFEMGCGGMEEKVESEMAGLGKIYRLGPC
jgi:hypothetical protein